MRSGERASFLHSTVTVGVAGVSCSNVRWVSGAGGGAGGLQSDDEMLGDPLTPSLERPERMYLHDKCPKKAKLHNNKVKIPTFT